MRSTVHRYRHHPRTVVPLPNWFRPHYPYGYRIGTLLRVSAPSPPSVPPIGAHLNTKGGVASAITEASTLGATALQFFTSSPQMWRAKAPDEAAAERFAEARRLHEAIHGTLLIVVHDSYLINLCAAGEELREKSYRALVDEFARCAAYGVTMVNSHMGAHVGQGEEEGTRLVGAAVRRLLDETDPGITLLMETTAGAGSALGSTFEGLARMLEAIGGSDRVGVCLDTCHVFAAGYDIGTPEGASETLDRFDSLLGIDRLRAVHLNDSKGGLGSKKDRHANLGEGEIGTEGLRAFATETRLRAVPIILETPHDADGHKRDLEMLRSWFDVQCR